MENTFKNRTIFYKWRRKTYFDSHPKGMKSISGILQLESAHFIEIQKAPVQIQISEVIFMTEIISGKPTRSAENF